jgi:hypothetical protein
LFATNGANVGEFTPIKGVNAKGIFAIDQNFIFDFVRGAARVQVVRCLRQNFD